MRLVIIESPYAGNIELNTAYAKACLRDSLSRGEAPIASHLLYPQVLDENDPAQRAHGIAAGLAWRKAFDEREERISPHTLRAIREPVLPVFYLDLGISSGMSAALALYAGEGIVSTARFLFGDQETLYDTYLASSVRRT